MFWYCISYLPGQHASLLSFITVWCIIVYLPLTHGPSSKHNQILQEHKSG